MKVKLLFAALSAFFILSCSEEKPKVKIINESNTRVDANFILTDCACPAFSFRNVMPFSETEYRSCSANEYVLNIKDSIKFVDTVFNTAYDKKYDIRYNGTNCSISESDQ